MTRPASPALPNLPHHQRGSVFPLMLLVLGGMLMAGGFVLDSVTLNTDTSQLKRATDAAALALGRAYPTYEDSGDAQTVAEQYVRANLGLNSALLDNLGTITVSNGTGTDSSHTYKVSATVTNVPMLLGVARRELVISSTAEVRQVSTEVALAIPNTLNETSANLAALRRLGNHFAETLIGDSTNTWLALVPFSQAVSVYDANQSGRARAWASSIGLNPVELTSLFKTGQITSLADQRAPDRRAKLLCMYRGLNTGENYFWDEAPAGQFRIYYRADLPSNDIAYGITPYTITWVGPNPSFGAATGANDTRYLIADRGCPSAPLLPLTNDLTKISERLDKMSARFNVNYAIAMGWAAMALAPEFRGTSGWALDDDLPKDFDDGNNERIKAVVLLVNSSESDWFDSDGYNAYVGESVDGAEELGTDQDALITQRFKNLCSSFQAHNLKFYLIVTGKDESGDDGSTGASDFRRVAGPGLAGCASSSNLTYLNGADFVESESSIQERLDAIVDDLQQQGNFVRLIE